MFILLFIQFDAFFLKCIMFLFFFFLVLLINLLLQLKVRAAVEMALIDAVAKSVSMPLWRLFGGVSNTLTTDITVKFLPQ